MHKLEQFNLGDMAQCTGAIRRIGTGSEDFSEIAGSIVDYFYENLVTSEGKSACALVRFFRTRAYRSLTPELKLFADEAFAADLCFPTMKCLVLEATRGERPQWNSIQTSRAHRAIPLPSEELVRQMPMISRLIQDFGYRITDLLDSPENLFIGKSEEDYNIFLVPNAEGSEIIPAQKDFVIPYGIKSVIGFGGTLPTGNLFAVIIFSKVRISRDIADMFRCLALATNLAVMRFDTEPAAAIKVKRDYGKQTGKSQTPGG